MPYQEEHADFQRRIADPVVEVREVAIGSARPKLIDFVKEQGWVESGLFGNANSAIDMALFAVNGLPSGRIFITKKTKLKPGDIVTRYGLTTDAEDLRISALQRERGPIAGRYRHEIEHVRLVERSAA